MNSGDIENFEENWSSRPEANYSHFTQGAPQNQIQFAFREHWKALSQFCDQIGLAPKTSVELGCGRGSLSHYVAEQGVACTFVDLSPKALELAQLSCNVHGLDGKFLLADCEKTGLPPNGFDLVLSIGLIEHFDNPERVINEHFRICSRGGIIFMYIVPQLDPKVNKAFRVANTILSQLSTGGESDLTKPKSEVYRVDYSLADYLDYLSDLPLDILYAGGAYSVPMLSPSPEFPFSLNNSDIELQIVKEFSEWMESGHPFHDKINRLNPWLCGEDFGNALLIVCRKLEG